jgi:hypothetical protein
MDENDASAGVGGMRSVHIAFASHSIFVAANQRPRARHYG